MSADIETMLPYDVILTELEAHRRGPVSDEELARAIAECLKSETPIPVVIVTVPGDKLGPVEMAIHHREWGVEVDIRPAGTRVSWTPLQLMGGSFETRPN